MKVFITGGDGFLGSHIIRELLKRNFQVKALLQNQNFLQFHKGLTVEIIIGDILDAPLLMEAVKGCSIFIHAAANTSIWPSKSEAVLKTNILGTINCMDAALANNIQKFIFIGSAVSFGYGNLETPGNETCESKVSKIGVDYIYSKHRAFELVNEYVKNRGLRALTIAPTYMIGPFDSKPGSGAMIMAIYNRKLPGYTKGGKNFVSVKDVAIAVCNGIEKGEIGEAYIAGNVNMTYKEAFSLIAQTLNVKFPARYIPSAMTIVYGFICELLCLFTGKKPVVSFHASKLSLIGNYFSTKKAVKELDMPQTDIREAIKEAHNWFLENNYLKQRTG